jgi:tetratricopeptide (TPR) repeat protein
MRHSVVRVDGVDEFEVPFHHERPMFAVRRQRVALAQRSETAIKLAPTMNLPGVAIVLALGMNTAVAQEAAQPLRPRVWLLADEAAVAPDALANIRRASDAEAIGNHASAIDLYTQVLSSAQLAPKERRSAYIGRGVAHGNMGEFEAAIADFTRAIALDPNLSDAYYDRALMESDVGRYAASLADFAAIANAASSYPSYYYYRGYVHFEHNDFDQAISDLTTASLTMVQDASVYYRRAKAYDAKGDREAAIADFSAAIRLKPADPDMLRSAYRWRGTEAFALKRYEQAIADFSALMKLDPNDADATMRRANAYYAQGRYAAAVADTSLVIHVNERAGALFPWPGIVDPSRCFADRIIDRYNAGMRIPGLDPYAHVLRARAYLKLGRKNDAVADYTAAVNAIPAGADDSVSAELTKARQ